MQKKIAIYIGSGQKGLLLSVAKLLCENFEVWILARDQNVQKLVESLLPQASGRCLNLSAIQPCIERYNVLNEVILREKKYDIRYSQLLSYDRALGQGYLGNADKHPHVGRSLWGHERKLETLLKDQLRVEKALERCKPDLIFSWDRPSSLEHIASIQKIPFLSIMMARVSSRYHFVENCQYKVSGLYERIQELVTSCKSYTNEESVRFEVYSKFKHDMKQMDYSYIGAIKKAVSIIANDSYSRLKGVSKKNSYVYCGWVPVVLRKSRIYRRLTKIGHSPKEVKRYRLIYFALQMEPETSLMQVSPEFSNSFEAITWISKSLPADTLLVVKENPWSYGVRSRAYYDRLCKIGNVILAHPAVPSLEWIQESRIVATITGTVGYEAVYFHRPVLSFGRNQVINCLPTVRYVSNYMETRAAVDELLSIPSDGSHFGTAHRALYSAIYEKSFDLPGFEFTMKSCDLHMEMASIIINRLWLDYGHLLGQE